jgi:hypothetical protein
MRHVLLTALIVAVLVGPLVAFVSTVASVRTTVKYEPGLTPAEMNAYNKRSVSELEAFLKSREVKFTAPSGLRESIGEGYFWKEIARKSIVPGIGIFFGCVLVGGLERPRALVRPEDSRRGQPNK